MKQPPLTSRTRVLGVIGDPIGHSLSPVLHNYVLKRLGLDYRYLAFHVARERGVEVGQAFRTLGLAGLNATLPHKETLLAQVETLSPEAIAVGAVNTLGLDHFGRLAGHNTDVAGFLGALELRGLEDSLRDQTALVLGAGGASRAVLYALGRAGVKSIHLANRTRAKAEALAAWLAQHYPDLRVDIVPLEEGEALREALAHAAITVNVTPLGMTPEVKRSPLPDGLLPRPDRILYDTIYNPEPTLLMRRAEDAGCVTVGGLDMLIIQGMESLCWWLGETLPWRGMLDDIRLVLRRALAERM